MPACCPTSTHREFLAKAILSLTKQTHAQWRLRLLINGVHAMETALHPDVVAALAECGAKAEVHVVPAALSAERSKDWLAASPPLSPLLEHAPFIAYLDADDERTPTSLEEQLAFLRDNADVDAVGCNFVMHRLGKGNKVVHADTSTSWLRSSKVSNASHDAIAAAFCGKPPIALDLFLLTPSLMFRRDALLPHFPAADDEKAKKSGSVDDQLDWRLVRTMIETGHRFATVQRELYVRSSGLSTASAMYA